MRRAYKFRAYATHPQEARAVRLLADHCDLYNAALEERREAWRMRQASISYLTQSVQLKDIRRADPGGQGRHSFTAQQQTLRRLGAVFQGLYDRCRAGQRPGYPRFKPRSRFDQVTRRTTRPCSPSSSSPIACPPLTSESPASVSPGTSPTSTATTAWTPTASWRPAWTSSTDAHSLGQSARSPGYATHEAAVATRRWLAAAR